MVKLTALRDYFKTYKMASISQLAEHFNEDKKLIDQKLRQLHAMGYLNACANKSPCQHCPLQRGCKKERSYTYVAG